MSKHCMSQLSNNFLICCSLWSLLAFIGHEHNFYIAIIYLGYLTYHKRYDKSRMFICVIRFNFLRQLIPVSYTLSHDARKCSCQGQSIFCSGYYLIRIPYNSGGRLSERFCPWMEVIPFLFVEVYHYKSRVGRSQKKWVGKMIYSIQLNYTWKKKKDLFQVIFLIFHNIF